MFDIEADIESQLFALRPTVGRTVLDRGIGIAVVIR